MEELPIRSGDDVVRIRQQVRMVAEKNGLSLVEQTKVVTAASELARNALVHGGGGTARIEVVTSGLGRAGSGSASATRVPASVTSTWP